MELERFRENGDTSDGYTEFCMPNGKGYAMKGNLKKRSYKRYFSYILNVVLLLMLLIFVIIYAMNPNCECSVPPSSNGGSHNKYTMMNESENGIANGRHIVAAAAAAGDEQPTTTSSIHFSSSVTTTEPITTTEATIAKQKTHLTLMQSDVLSSSDEKLSSSEEFYYILPGDLHPISYKITLIPHFLSNMTTNGSVSIDFNCNFETKEIILNARELTIDENSVIVTSLEDREINQVTAVVVSEESEMVKIHLSEYLKPSTSYNVVMSFIGLIKETPKGLYKTVYDLGDKYGIMVNTQFSPNDARSVFPCFDEPMYKAKFTFILGRIEPYHTLSNMNLKSTTPRHFETLYYMDTYEESPPMSTYLTAFAITEFKSVTMHKGGDSNITFSGYSDVTELSEMAYIMQWLEKLTLFFGKYFEVPFPLPKLDVIAVPDHFFDAMENWGMITFRKNLAYVNEKTTAADKQFTVITLAHEIAHQWFGNLVTPKWWNNLWLKEGFSNYFGYFAVNKIEPEWQMNDQFQTGILEQALKADALETSLPLSKSVAKTSMEIFDTVSYDKGASIFRMTSNFMGPENFKKGVITYLQQYSYSNAGEDDLWDIFEKNIDSDYTGNINVKEVMETWTNQSGYPVIHVLREEENIRFYQHKLLLNGKNDDKSVWWIPITYTTQSEKNFNDTRPKLWLSKQDTTHQVHFSNRNDWFLVNLQQTGFYRVNYDENNWLKLIEDFETFPNTIKAQLISDSLFLARANVLTYDYALSMTLGMTKELDYLPWKAVSNHLFYIGNLLKRMPAYGNFKRLVINLIRRAYTKYEDTSLWLENFNNTIDQKQMVNILDIACHFDQPECLKSSYNLFQEKMSTETHNNMIPFFIRHIVYCSAVKYGGQNIWQYTYKTLNSTSDTEERRRLLHALGCSKETWLLTKTLFMLLPNLEIQLTTDEMMTVFDSVMSNLLGHEVGYNFIRYQWPQILNRYKSPLIVYKMVSNVVTFINSPHSVSELSKLVEIIQNKTNEKSNILQQSIELASNNLIWIDRNYNTVELFLNMFVTKYNIQ